jgi:hypothetical protein
MPKKTARHHHNVYVIELDKAVLKESKFRRANPEYDPARPCVYVGMTGLTVQQRFANHRKGIKSNRFAHQYFCLRSRRSRRLGGSGILSPSTFGVVVHSPFTIHDSRH